MKAPTLARKKNDLSIVLFYSVYKCLHLTDQNFYLVQLFVLVVSRFSELQFSIRFGSLQQQHVSVRLCKLTGTIDFYGRTSPRLFTDKTRVPK